MSKIPDDLIPLFEVPRRIPGRPTRVTVWRWTDVGIHGVILPSVLVGARLMVSESEIDKFMAAVAAARAAKRSKAHAKKAPKKPAGAKR